MDNTYEDNIAKLVRRFGEYMPSKDIEKVYQSMIEAAKVGQRINPNLIPNVAYGKAFGLLRSMTDEEHLRRKLEQRQEKDKNLDQRVDPTQT